MDWNSSELAIEQAKGHSTQIAKELLFNAPAAKHNKSTASSGSGSGGDVKMGMRLLPSCVVLRA